MEAIAVRNVQAEQLVARLNSQLAALSRVAEEKQKSQEQEEIATLLASNEKVRQEITALKNDLVFWEAQNGLKQVSLPHVKAKEVVAEVVKSEPAEVPVQSSVNEKGKKAAKTQKSGDKNSASSKEGKDKAQNAKSIPADSLTIDASRLDMRVGRIVDVQPHPDADTLFVETVDVGEATPRTIISGLVKHYKLEQMQDRLAVFLLNLKPAKMRGILSQGMIMCASTPERVEILDTPQAAQIGDRVFCEGFTGTPDVQLNPKKKIWEQIQPDLHVNNDRVATYKGGAFTIEGKGVCTAPSMNECPIK